MFNDFTLDKKSKVPYYYQIYSYLLRKIRNNELAEGNRFPNEMVLCKIFNVSRISIRGALGELERDGYITRGRGQGTFILTNSLESNALQKTSSIVDELKEKGISIEAKILEQNRIVADEIVRAKLQIDKKIKVLFIKRLTLADREPLYVTNAYFPNDIFKNIKQGYLENLSFTKLVQDHFNLHINHRKRILRSDLPDDEITNILKITDSEKKVISYLETFWTFDYYGRNRIIYFEEFFKGSKSKFIFEA
jgi:GntR family transcriptional regulator